MMTEELLDCPFCGRPPSVIPESDDDDRFFRLQHHCFGFSRTFFIDWCRLERLIRIWNTRDLGITTDYEKIRKHAGVYWARGIFPHVPAEEWRMAAVVKGNWTAESGKTHCLWYYFDGSGGNEIDKGEWIYIPQPQPGDG